MFHLCKSTRVYTGEPYCGPSSDGVVMEFKYFHEAKYWASTLQEYNPVGWNIFESESGKLVDGYDFFEEDGNCFDDERLMSGGE